MGSLAKKSVPKRTLAKTLFHFEVVIAGSERRSRQVGIHYDEIVNVVEGVFRLLTDGTELIAQAPIVNSSNTTIAAQSIWNVGSEDLMKDLRSRIEALKETVSKTQISLGQVL